MNDAIDFTKVKSYSPSAIYGILTYENSDNMGDEIQSIAAERLIPRTDFLVDRDSSRCYPMTDGAREFGKIRTIYNGWFSSKSSQFPLAQNIDPLFISVHINDTQSPSLADNVAYWKQYEPIGCRDIHTLNLFRNRGIEAYFSGCLTLTLVNRFNQRNDDILIIDSHIWFSSLLKDLIPKIILDKAVYLEQERKNISSQDKREEAQRFLDRLARAKLVITSRLHTALPCVAFHTPVIFIHDDLADVRFSGLLKFFKAYTTGDKLDVNLEKYSNPQSHELDTITAQMRSKVSAWLAKPTPLDIGDQTTILVATINTHVDNPQAKIWERTAKAQGYPYIMLGVGEKWQGWKWRTRKYLNLLKHMTEVQIFLLLDCNDIYFTGPPGEFIEKFRGLDSRIVIGSERQCCTGKWQRQDLREYVKRFCTEHAPVNNPYIYLNGGGVIGYRNELIQLLEDIKDEPDDQAGYLEQFIFDPMRIKLDYSQCIIGNSSYDASGLESKNWEYDPRDNRVVNRITGQKPVIMHFPANIYDKFKDYYHLLPTIAKSPEVAAKRQNNDATFWIALLMTSSVIFIIILLIITRTKRKT